MDYNGERHGVTSSNRSDDAGSLRDQARVVRRYWWVVALVAIVALGAGVLSAIQTPTSFTGRSSLIVSSENRSPDQDAVLVQGYVAYFNDDAYQEGLLAKADVASDVDLVAQAAAASPILLIQATATGPGQAQGAATAVARAFQTDINRVRGAENEAAIASLQEQLSALEADGGDAALVLDIQDQIQELASDEVNMLQELQFEGGVTENAPSVATNALLGLLGGLLLGLVAALIIGRLVERRDSSADTTAAADGTGSTVENLRARARRDQREDDAGLEALLGEHEASEAPAQGSKRYRP